MEEALLRCLDAVSAEVAFTGSTGVEWDVVRGARCVIAVAGFSRQVHHQKVVGSC